MSGRRIIISATLIIFAISVSGCAVVFPRSGLQSSERVTISQPATKLPEHERLTFKVEWLGVPVGTITASINGIKKIKDKDAYELEIIAKTNDFCSRIYKIDDRYVSYMDMKDLCTLRHEVYRREGRYGKDAVTEFDQANHKAYFKNFLDKSEKIVDIPPKVQDPISAAYYFRMIPIKIGEKIGYSVYNNESCYELYGVAEKKGMIKLPKVGWREVFHIQPYAKLKGEIVKKGRASTYFSCDEKRLPLFGSVRAPLFTEVIAYLEADNAK